MKKVFLSMMALLIFAGCQNDDESNAPLPGPSGVVGKWGLTEILADPGDGSGTFQAIVSDKTVRFFSDGTLESNGDLCSMNGNSDSEAFGTYSLVDSTIAAASCADLTWPIRFEVSGDELIFHYPCIEPCQAKYLRIILIE